MDPIEKQPKKPGFRGRPGNPQNCQKCLAKRRRRTELCQRPAELNPHTGRRTRCRFHGGLTTGPKTAEGKKRVGDASRNRALNKPLKHGEYTQAAQEVRRAARERLAAIKAKGKGLK
jgi:hypothetical protein